MGLAGSVDTEGSAGGNVATGTDSHARQNRYPGLPGWVYGRQPNHIKICVVEKLLKLEIGLRKILEEAKVHQGL